MVTALCSEVRSTLPEQGKSSERDAFQELAGLWCIWEIHSARLEGTKAFFLGTSPGQADQSKGHLGLG